MTHLLQGKSVIAGVLLEDNARAFRVVSPLTGQPLEPEFHECTASAVERALTLVDDAFVSYRTLSAEKRAEFPNRIVDEILAIGDVLLERANQETGLPLDRLTGERGRTVGQLRLFAEVAREASWRDARIDTALPDRKPLPRPDLRWMLQPLGAVIVFGSSNFPLAFSVAGGDTASALAAGCPVVVKAHQAHTGTSELVGGGVTRAVEACSQKFRYVNDAWDDAVVAKLDPVGRLIDRSNILGGNQRITNTVGGNASAKLTGTDALTGQPTEVFWVKGSGGLRTSLIDPPLHSFIPSEHVDHMHPNATISIAASRRSVELTKEIYGEEVIHTPWLRPGFELGLAMQKIVQENSHAQGIMTSERGLINWAHEEEEFYEMPPTFIEYAAAFVEAKLLI